LNSCIHVSTRNFRRSVSDALALHEEAIGSRPTDRRTVQDVIAFSRLYEASFGHDNMSTVTVKVERENLLRYAEIASSIQSCQKS
jgi:hypothetical protein